MSQSVKLTYVTLGILIVIGAFFVIIKQKPKENPAPNITNRTTTNNVLINNLENKNTDIAVFPAGSIAVVFISDTGFDPANIQVPIDTTVRFLNQTEDQVRIASNPHPIHTDLSGFDSGKNIGEKDDFYEYIFGKKGVWKFHNHYRPDQKGSVIVVE